MEFPKISDTRRLERLAAPKGKVPMVLDTDTYNEVDDQFAVIYSLLSPEKLDVKALYAAPFHNNRSSGPADGMEKSYDEILRLLDRINVSPDGFVYKGSNSYLPDYETAVESKAARDLADKAMNAGDDPLYVVAIGAITNVASAIIMEPRIIEKIVVVWLGGHSIHWPPVNEFNLSQDIPAAQVVFDSGVPLIHIPCMGVTSHLHTTLPEIDAHVRGKGAIGDYLAQITAEYTTEPFGWSKVLWDIATIAWLLDESWTPSSVVHSPILTDQGSWSHDTRRHMIRAAYHVHRDPIFRDLFGKLAQAS